MTIRVETHLDGSQSLHIGPCRVEWDLFGQYAVREDAGNRTVAKFTYQNQAIAYAQALTDGETWPGYEPEARAYEIATKP